MSDILSEHLEVVAIRVGDTVQEDDGPLMKVVSQGSGWVQCEWTDGKVEKVARFAPNKLFVIEKPEGAPYEPTADDEKRLELIAREVRASIGPKKLEPLGDCVIFRAIDADRTPAGLLLPEKAAEPRKKAIVVAVGPGNLLDDGTRAPMPSVTPGDHIILWAEAPTPGSVFHTGEELWITHAQYIACIVRPLVPSS